MVKDFVFSQSLANLIILINLCLLAITDANYYLCLPKYLFPNSEVSFFDPI